MYFLEIFSLKRDRTKFSFNIDLLIETAFNHSLRYGFIWNNIVSIVIYFYLKTNNWINKTVDIIVKVLNFNKKANGKCN